MPLPATYAPKSARETSLYCPPLSMDPKFDAAQKALTKGSWVMVWWQNCLLLPCCFGHLHLTLFTAVHEDDMAESAFWKQVIVLRMPP